MTFTITTNGDVKDLIVTEENPTGWGFGKSAMKAASKLKYPEPILDGIPIEIEDKKMTYKFQSED